MVPTPSDCTCETTGIIIAGIYTFFVSVPEDLVLVESVLKTSEVHSLLESTGLLVFFKGFGGNESTGDGTW